jgi:CPA2 family monovalent cation:H+ antiporter-2
MAETTLLEVGIALVTIAAAGTVARRLGQSVIPAYILADVRRGRLTAARDGG